MITKKRSVLIVLIITIILSTAAYATPSNWAEDFMKSVLLEDLSSDELLNSDKLQQAITREEFAELTVILYSKATGESIDEVVQWNPFHDTDNKMVSKAYNLGIVSGTGVDLSDRPLFSPNDKVTRQEIAVMLVKELNILGVDVSTNNGVDYYNDEDLIADWAYNSVSFATQNGIISGVGNNNVAPTANATREEALVLINKVALKYGWIDNKVITPKFNETNSVDQYGFLIPNYNLIQLRAYKTNSGVKYIISHLVDSYKVDIEKQKSDLINILVNTDTLSYDAFAEIRERILTCYDLSSKKFISSDTVYIDATTGYVSYNVLNNSYIKISVDNEFIVEYINK